VAKTKQATLPAGAAAFYERDDAVSPAALTKFGEATGDKYKVRIISAGEGSSGIYPIDMLEADIPDALPKGSRMRANHDGICEAGGDIRRVISRTIDTPWREGDDMVTNIQVAGQWSEFVREFGDIIGLSISLAGEYEDIPEGGEESHRPGYWVDAAGKEHKRVVAHLLPMSESPYNSLDFVEAPGANGRILAAVESARERLAEMNIREQAGFTGALFEKQLSDGAPPRRTEEDIEVDEQTLSRMLAESEKRTLEAVREALTPTDPPAPKPTVKAVTEAVVTAGLTEQGRDAVYEAIERGDDLAAAIEREKAREAAIAERVSKQQEANGIQLGSFYEAGDKSRSSEGELEALMSEVR
jgi:hypothetical protein